MRIETVPLREMQQTWEAERRHRMLSRSPEMTAIAKALNDMKDGDARAVLYDGWSGAYTRERIRYAASIVGKKVTTVIDDANSRVLFALER